MRRDPTLDHQLHMRQALREAEAAVRHGDVPVGCVIVAGGAVIAAAHNERELRGDPTAHAECLAIRAAALAVGTWRIPDAVLYVTLEPCPMCAGAILQSRIDRVIFGAPDPKAGAAGSVVSLFQHPGLPQRAQVTGGVLAEESVALLQRFFAERR